MNTKSIRIYLTISFGIMVPVCAIVMLLNWLGFTVHNTILGFAAIALGGTSTAVAGAIAAKRTGKINSYTKLLQDFFMVKQPVRFYAAILLVFLLMFGYRMVSGAWHENRGWLSLPGLFATAILFGGIEEIGWRYLFQPALEKKLSFPLASCVTFLLWGVWHILYFFVDGSIGLMTPESLLFFLLGLLGNTFVLGAIHHLTKSLWLCVFYHALLNAFTQALEPAGTAGTFGIMALSITLSVLFVRRSENKPVKG